MCSPQYLPFLNPVCSLRSIGSRAVDILFRITLLNTLLVMDSNVIPLQFLQRLRFPFFGSLTISPVFQSTDISSPSHIFLKISARVSVMTSPPAFSIFALTPSAPGAFLTSCCLLLISLRLPLVGPCLQVDPYAYRYSSLSGMSSTSIGASLLRMVSKCVFHSCVCFSRLVITTPSA